MPNDIDALLPQLKIALRDTDDETWTDTEKRNLVKWAVASLWPRISKPLDPTATTVTLVSETYYYSLPAGVYAVSYIDRVGSDGTEYGPMSTGSWTVEGSAIDGTAKLHVSPVIANGGGTLRLGGYGRYDLTANYILDEHIPLVLAMARAEAYRRMAADREQFKVWLSRNQTQNVTVNELIMMINEADNEVMRLRSLTKTWQRPVPARRG